MFNCDNLRDQLKKTTLTSVKIAFSLLLFLLSVDGVVILGCPARI